MGRCGASDVVLREAGAHRTIHTRPSDTVRRVARGHDATVHGEGQGAGFQILLQGSGHLEGARQLADASRSGAEWGLCGRDKWACGRKARNGFACCSTSGCASDRRTVAASNSSHGGRTAPGVRWRFAFSFAERQAAAKQKVAKQIADGGPERHRGANQRRRGRDLGEDINGAATDASTGRCDLKALELLSQAARTHGRRSAGVRRLDWRK
mmetsp:Transcript_113544/g.222642  ORF Transcript_113544/g.222642 Transcript_113544/m.222642 type:complete len:211 (+) Transcript_113544:311-943(+)